MPASLDRSKLTTITSILLGTAVFGFGIWGLLSARGIVSSTTGVLLGVALVCAGGISRKSTKAAYACTGITFLTAVFFAVYFVATERFFPGGILLLVSFLALFLVLLGIFLQLQRQSRQV